MFVGSKQLFKQANIIHTRITFEAGVAIKEFYMQGN